MQNFFNKKTFAQNQARSLDILARKKNKRKSS